jgi:type IV pilus assembly protein PilO
MPDGEAMKNLMLELLRLKRRSLTGVAMLALVLLTLSMVVDRYQEPKIAAAQTKWSELRRQVAAGDQRDVASAYRQGGIDLETVRGRIAPRRQFARLLSEILEQAASSGVVAGQLSYKPRAIKEEKLLAYAVTMSASGRYAAVKSFLTDLLDSRELVVVEEFSMANSDLFEEKLVMNLLLTIYLREDA